MRKSIVIVTWALALLAGCSGQIETAKKAASLTADFTNEQVLDNDPNCASTDWQMFKDSTGRELVEYTCTVKLPPEVVDSNKQKALQALKGEVDRQAGFYAAARLQAEENAIKGTDGIRIQLMQAQQRLDGAQYRVQATQGAGASHQHALQEMQTAQEYFQQVNAQMAEYQAKAEPIMMQIVNFEEAYSMAVQRLEAEDTKTIEEHYAKNFKMDRKVYFLVKGDEVTRVAHTFTVDGRDLSQQVDAAFALRMLETPGRQEKAAEFWANRQPWPVMAIKKFPYDCNPQQGCVDKTKPN